MTTTPVRPEDVEPKPSLTPFQTVLRYYPQRVQLIVMSALNLLFIGIVEFTAAEPSVLFVGAVNAFALALLVFFYGEQRTSSKQAIEDWLDAAEHTKTSSPTTHVTSDANYGDSI